MYKLKILKACLTCIVILSTFFRVWFVCLFTERIYYWASLLITCIQSPLLTKDEPNQSIKHVFDFLKKKTICTIELRIVFILCLKFLRSTIILNNTIQIERVMISYLSYILIGNMMYINLSQMTGSVYTCSMYCF